MGVSNRFVEPWMMLFDAILWLDMKPEQLHAQIAATSNDNSHDEYILSLSFLNRWTSRVSQKLQTLGDEESQMRRLLISDSRRNKNKMRSVQLVSVQLIIQYATLWGGNIWIFIYMHSHRSESSFDDFYFNRYVCTYPDYRPTVTRVSGTFPSPQDSRFRVPTPCSISHLVFHSYTINVTSVDSIVATTISAIAKLPASKGTRNRNP